MSALRRGFKHYAWSGVGDLTRRQIMAAVDKIAKTGKRGAAKDLRKPVRRGSHLWGQSLRPKHGFMFLICSKIGA